ncbi:MAG TPA: glycosyltransferase [Chloroflexota bacterium]|nr:glycosyltransferase [Chloroflexota bacterium]
MRTRSLVNAWRLLRGGDLAGLGRRLVARVARLGSGRPVRYSTWRAEHVVLTDADRARTVELAAGLHGSPSFTLVTEVGPDTDPEMLRATLESVAAQLWPGWVLCLATELATEPATGGDLSGDLAAVVAAVGDTRIRVTGPEPAALGDWVAWVPVGDVVHEACLFALAHAVSLGDAPATAYTDNDHVNARGRFLLPHCKPDWNPDLLTGQDYLTGLVAYRQDVAAGAAGAGTPHERALRATAGLTASEVLHVPHVLYSVRIGAGGAPALDGTGGTRVVWPVPDPPPRVSILIPTRDQGRLLEKCVGSLIGDGAVTDYPGSQIEIVLVDHESTEPRARAVIDGLDSDPAHRVVTFSGPFNFAAMVNRAAEAATGDVFVLLNNDTEAISPGWLTEMVGHLARPEVGVVGALLLFSDGTIQHAGVHPGVGGLMGHGHKHRRGDDPGYFGRLTVAHEVAAVTGACLGITRANWERLGGLDEEYLAVAYNDIDLCLRAREAGLRVVFTPHAVLHHHESVSRGFDDDPARNERLAGEVAVMRERWGDQLDVDPAYSPNLTLTGRNFTLAQHPRVEPVWR